MFWNTARQCRNEGEVRLSKSKVSSGPTISNGGHSLLTSFQVSSWVVVALACHGVALREVGLSRREGLHGCMCMIA
jgi:hypothetical protein